MISSAYGRSFGMGMGTNAKEHRLRRALGVAPFRLATDASVPGMRESQKLLKTVSLLSVEGTMRSWLRHLKKVKKMQVVSGLLFSRDGLVPLCLTRRAPCLDHSLLKLRSCAGRAAGEVLAGGQTLDEYLMNT